MKRPRSLRRTLHLVLSTLSLLFMLQAIRSPANAATVFWDGFESGNLSQWTVVNGLIVQQQEVYAGTWAARSTSTGSAAYAYKTLTSSQSELYIDERLKVVSQGPNNVSLLRLRTSTGAAILTMLRVDTGTLRTFNEVTGVTTSSPRLISVGVWHELEVHLIVNGASSTIEVWLDGTKVNELSKTDSYGTTGVGRVLVGDSATGRTFDFAYDEVYVSTTADFLAPSVPAGLTANAVSSSKVNLSWNASTDTVGVTGYTIYRDGAQIATVNGSTTTYSDTSVAPSTTYSYKVDAFDAAGNHSAQSAAASASTPAADIQAPTVPTGLSATAINAGRVDLSWNSSTDNVGVTGYTIYRDGNVIGNVGGSITSYSDTTVSASTTYTYKVDAFDAAGNHSARSAPASVITPAPPDTQAPTVPQNLTATAASSGEVDLSWDASADNVGVTGYGISRDGTRIDTVGGSTTTYMDTTVSPSTTYSYTVDAIDAAGNQSDQSAPASVTTPSFEDTSAPTTPDNVTATAISSNRVDVSWTPSTDDVGVTQYTIYRDGAKIDTVGGNETTYTDTSVAPLTSYTYRVDAVDAAGNRSARSDLGFVTTPAPPDTVPPTAPTNFTATAIGPGEVDLSWGPSTDNVAVTGYAIYRDSVQIGNVGVGATTFQDKSVTNNATYTYTVDGFDAAGNHSALSSAAIVKTPGLIFADSFESGSLSNWNVRNGLIVQQQVVYAGNWAARATSTGSAAYAYKVLSSPQPSLYYDMRFRVISQGNSNVSLVRFRTGSGAGIDSIMRNTSGKLSSFNEVTGATKNSSTSITTGVWHELKVHLVINGASGSIDVWLDGTRLTDVSRTDNFGTDNTGRVLIGDSATGRAFDNAFDNVVVTAAADVVPPTTPTGLTATALGAKHVNIAWNASSDDAAVSGYNIYRNGSLVGSVFGGTTGYADFTPFPSSTYSYTVDAVDAAGNHSPLSAAVTATTPAASGGDPTIMTAGDIACSPLSPQYNGGAGTATACRQRATSDIIYNANPAAVLAVGDLQYESGQYEYFQQAFDSSWGRFKGIIHPVPGNHDYGLGVGYGYFNYFGPAAGDPSKGYYSYDVGSWHIIALNSECDEIGGCNEGSREEQWLRSDLAAHPNDCTLAYWHEPRFSSGTNGGYTLTTDAFWQDLFDSGVDVVVNGHDHIYERYAAQNPAGDADPNGIREFVVGTGGRSFEPIVSVQPNSEVLNGDTFGVLELTLHPTGYDWRFLPESGATFTDSGTGSCH